MSAETPNSTGPEFSRRLVLGGIVAAPAAVAAAPAALVEQMAMPAVVRAMMSSGLNADKVFDWAVDDYFHNTTIASYAEYMSGVSKLLAGKGNGDHIARTMNGPYPEYDDGTEDVMRIADLFSAEAKFAYFLRFRDKKESVDNWQQSPLFTDPDSEWVRATNLLEKAGIGADAELTLSEFKRVGREVLTKEITPVLRQAFNANPRQLSQTLREWFIGRDDRLQLVKSLLKDPEVGNGEEVDRFFDVPETQEPKLHAPEFMHSPQNDMRTYHFDMQGSIAEQRKALEKKYPLLDDERVIWLHGAIMVPAGSEVDQWLASQTIPNTQVHAVSHAKTPLIERSSLTGYDGDRW